MVGTVGISHLALPHLVLSPCAWPWWPLSHPTLLQTDSSEAEESEPCTAPDGGTEGDRVILSVQPQKAQGFPLSILGGGASSPITSWRGLWLAGMGAGLGVGFQLPAPPDRH